MFFSYFLNLFNNNYLYNFFNNIKQNYQFSDLRINIKIFFYFAQNYYSNSIKMLKIINQLLICLYKNYNYFCKKFSYYFKKNIKNFIYIKNIKLRVYLFIIFRISFLIIYKNNFIIYLYSKLFILFRSVCNFFKKKLYYNIFIFFYIIKIICYLR